MTPLGSSCVNFINFKKEGVLFLVLCCHLIIKNKTIENIYSYMAESYTNENKKKTIAKNDELFVGILKGKLELGNTVC
jgi:hypothetical protein